MAESKTFKFETDVPLKVLFSFDDFREKEWEDGGKSYGYGVRSDGDMGYINCSQKLHDLLQTLGVKKGISVTITKKTVELESGKPGYGFLVEKNGKIYATYKSSDAEAAPEAPETPQDAPESTQTPTTYEGIPELGAVMKACFKEAEMIIGEFGTGNADLRQTEMGLTARCLFIQVNRDKD